MTLILENTSWILDGEKVSGSYYGSPYTGTITDSRVKYGGKVQYTVELDSAIQVMGSTEERWRILVDREELLEGVV
jgi:hypothetical protein